MRKSRELAEPHSCLNKAADDEPLFVLRANDPLAATLVGMWCLLAHKIHSDAKIAEAEALARQMIDWRHQKGIHFFCVERRPEHLVAQGGPPPTGQGQG